MEEENTEEFIREITRHQGMLTAFIRSLLPRAVDPLDILQEVNITLWKKKGQFREGSNFKAWSFQVAKFHVLNERKKLKRAKTLVFDDDLLNSLAEGVPFVACDLDERLKALRVCIEKLRGKDQALLKVRYTQVGTIEDYAVQYGRNAGTLRAILRQLRVKLKACILGEMGREAL